MKKKYFNCIIYAYKPTIETIPGDVIKTEISATPVICDSFDAHQAKEAMLELGKQMYSGDEYVIKAEVVEIDERKLRNLLDGGNENTFNGEKPIELIM